MNATKRVIYCIVTVRVKVAYFAKNWRSRRVLISRIRRCNVGMF